jgi:hypothetical protein
VIGVGTWRGLVRHAACGVLILATAAELEASRPRTWRQDSFAAFAEGKAEGVSIVHDGTLQLAPELDELVTLDAERVWSLVALTDGTVYVGTGDGGQIFKVDADGNALLYFDTPEVSIHALAADANGHVYAGTAPDGLIYRISPSGVGTMLAATGAHYVWDLEFGGGGELFAATGEPAAILQIDRAGKVDTLVQVQDRHVMALTWVDERLYASTAEKGRIYEIEKGHRPRLLYEAVQEEIHSLVAGPSGQLFATLINDVKESETSGGTTAVVRFHPRTGGRVVWNATEGQALGIVNESTERLLFSVTEPPRIFLLDREDRISALIDLEGESPSRLVRTSAGEILVGMAQSGAVRRLRRSSRRTGRFDSNAHDFGGHSHWGRIYWQATVPEQTEIRFRTRSGNSAEPDDTWSAWSDVLDVSGRPVSSAPARYLQYRSTLTSSDPAQTPILHKVEVWARQANLRPEITDLQTYPRRMGETSAKTGAENTVNGKIASNSNTRRNLPQRKSLRVVRWQAEDPNGDDLSYDVYLRTLDQQEWKLAEEDISQNSILWDTETMPEGMTLLKLVASDRPNNGEGETLSAERIAGPFAIDNSPPEITAKAKVARDVVVDLILRDRISPVRKVQYSVDYVDRVVQVVPRDGVFDSTEEHARFTVSGLAPGEHVIAIQAWDALDNVGTQQIVVRQK